MAPWVVVVIGGFCIAAVGAIPSWRQPNRRARRLLARAEEKALGAVDDGDRVRVRGVARRGPEGTLRAPFTGRACLAFRVIVQVRLEGDWEDVFSTELCVPFELVAEGLEARVDGPFLLALEVDARGDNTEVEFSEPVRDALNSLGVAPLVTWARGRRLRYLEAVLEPGDPIWVLGAATKTVDPTGRRDTLRGQPLKRIISGTKRAPTIVADEDQPGVLEPFG
jgi:hypothetical protein